MNATRATQTADPGLERPSTLAGTCEPHSGPQEPRTAPPRPTPPRSGPLGTPQAASWLSVYPSRPGAPLVLPGATLAEAVGRLHRKAPALPPGLTTLLPLLAANLTQAQIGARLHLSESAVKHRVGRLYAALGVHNRVGAVASALACGLLPEDVAR